MKVCVHSAEMHRLPALPSWRVQPFHSELDLCYFHLDIWVIFDLDVRFSCLNKCFSAFADGQK